MALVLQDAPCAQLPDHPHLAAVNAESVPAQDDVPLAEAPTSCEEDVVSIAPPQKPRKLPEDTMKLHAYVNRAIKSAAAVQFKSKPPRI
ncbi:hypothetical protein PI125_g19455 [Phytophthora idaei]|nr:hypothetical protein PI125_g19455 [Phytophthora idaei]KAG3136165.1 hypothetical protein PI126_g17932 [Phytophthora idaei]